MHFVTEKVVPLPLHLVSERLHFFMKENYLLSTEGPKSTVFLYVLSNVAYNDAHLVCLKEVVPYQIPGIPLCHACLSFV